MRFLRTTLSCALLLVFALPAAGQELDVHVSADTVTVGERFHVSVTARHEFASPPSFPSPSPGDSLAFGDIEVLQRLTSESYARGDLRVDSVVYEVTTFALDTARLAPIPVVFTAAEDTFSVQTEPAIVPVQSLVPADAEDVKDLAPLVEFPRSFWGYVLIAAGLLLLAALVAFYLWRRRQKRAEEPQPADEPPTPPDVEALRRLKALEGVDLSRRDEIKPFYIELSDTLRTYVSRRLGVHALERTTRELIADLQARSLPDEETTGRIRNILVQSDYVKFADAEPSADESRTILGTANKVVEAVERQTRPKAEPEEITFEAGADEPTPTAENSATELSAGSAAEHPPDQTPRSS